MPHNTAHNIYDIATMKHYIQLKLINSWIAYCLVCQPPQNDPNINKNKAP